jgi:plastocyanin
VRILSITLVCGGLLAGCGGETEKPATPEAPLAAADDGCGEELEPVGGGGSYTPEQGTASVKGKVTWEGDAPPRRAIDVGAEAFCVQSHQDEPLRSETVVVGEGGGLANIVVRVTKGLEAWKFPDGTGEVLLDQKGCQYVPHVLAAQVGQSLKVRNSDPIMHNVHGINMKTNKDEFNWAQTKAGLESTKELRKPGAILVKCDVHGWMGSYVLIEKHPFFAVTGGDGAFELSKLPPGDYTIEAWHEKLGTQSQEITVGDGETKEIAFTFSMK